MWYLVTCGGAGGWGGERGTGAEAGAGAGVGAGAGAEAEAEAKESHHFAALFGPVVESNVGGQLFLDAEKETAGQPRPCETWL